MKSWSILVVLAAIFLVNGLVLRQAGWFGQPAHAASPSVRKAGRDTMSSAVARSQARCQPHHWRDCLLAR